MERIKQQNRGEIKGGLNASDASRGEMSIRADRFEKAKSDVRFWAREYFDTEMSFESRAKKGRIEYEELLKWESDAKYNYDRMVASEVDARFGSRYDRDKVENIGVLKPEMSIEATAGDFYQRRQRALNEAIEKSDDPDKETDLGAAQDLYRCVGEHIYYETDYETRRFDPSIYQRNRRAAHNNLIRQLNHLNKLTEKYGVQRFTLRNFETNDFIYNKDLDKGGYTDRRAEYDRATVEAYCRNAFSSQYDKALRDSGLS
ncbi:MAG: hypothetical protein Q4A70_01625 [Candidatus Saccharibacteria bacterium]|nr:hypothetical protein [Candidatus Saccharibacteria bacterium]